MVAMPSIDPTIFMTVIFLVLCFLFVCFLFCLTCCCCCCFQNPSTTNDKLSKDSHGNTGESHESHLQGVDEEVHYIQPNISYGKIKYNCN